MLLCGDSSLDSVKSAVWSRKTGERGRHPQRRVRLRGRLPALLNERPKDGVVKVIDVRCDADAQLSSARRRRQEGEWRTVDLSPRKVVADRTGVWIHDDAAIKGRWVAERCVREISGPIEHVARSKVGRERG